MDTRIVTGDDGDDPQSGQTLWLGRYDDGEAGLAWDWVQLDQGVVAMADPMSVVTNLRPTTRDGAPLPPYLAAVHLNALVHKLPWQDEVERVLRTPAPAPSGWLPRATGAPHRPAPAR
jgi:hypothetical protein